MILGRSLRRCVLPCFGELTPTERYCFVFRIGERDLTVYYRRIIYEGCSLKGRTIEEIRSDVDLRGISDV